MAQKSFKELLQQENYNPAEAFLSEAAPPPKRKPKGETKTERVNLLFRPSVKEGLEKLAFVNKTSLNDLLNTISEEYISTHAAEIEKYNNFFKE